MYDLIKDLSDPVYLNGFFNFVAQPFALAFYISAIFGIVYILGAFITALITKFVGWAMKVNIPDDEFSKYWSWSWFGLCYFAFEIISKKQHKRN